MTEISDLKGLLNNDFSAFSKIEQKHAMNFIEKANQNTIIKKPFLMIAIQNIDENIQHAGVVIKKLGIEYIEICKNIVSFLDSNKNSVYINTKPHFKDKHSYDNQNLVFSKNVYFYTDEVVVAEEDIIKHYKQNGLNAIIRDNTYRKNTIENKKPDLFICHDSRDKDFVEKIYYKLIQNYITVWYDKYSLKLGQSLTDKINEGIKDCRFGLLILSKSFLSNEKWVKYELQSLTVKDIVNKENIILPIWLDINEDDLKDSCLWLLDKKAAKASDGIDKVVSDILSIIKSKKT